VLEDLIAHFTLAREDDGVRVVVLASTHDRVFSSGGDLREFAAAARLVDKYDAADRFPRLFTLIGELGKPVIAAVNGHALAGALGLVLACDLVIASTDAKFGAPEINVGVFPFVIAALISRNVPRKRCAEIVLLGELFTAETAERLGIVNRVVAPEDFQDCVDEWAERLATRSPVLLKLGKDALARQQDMALGDAMDYLRGQLTLAFSTEDLQEGVAAFFDKRAPRWPSLEE
jgi:enoyl-CoA hydratase